MPSLKSLFVLAVAGAATLLTGCNSMEHKLGRGLANIYEPLRMGEMRRSIEQTYLADGPVVADTYGVVHGFDRTVERTLAGVFDVVTFPIPSDPLILPVNPVFPDSQKPMTASSAINSSKYIGIGDQPTSPLFPGNQFDPLDN